MRRDLPSGTVTFLFTDVEGSTRLLHELGAEGYAEALAEHCRVVREACAAHGGVEVDTQGDAFFFAFRAAPGALRAAREANEALAQGPIQVRMGIHTGTPHLTSEGYVGEDVHKGARIAAAGHGGQVLVSRETGELAGVELADLGEHRLKDFAEPVWIFQLDSGRFPPLKTVSNTNLPRPASSFVGREREVEEVLALLRAGARMVTLTGPGGSGKTRLAIEAAAELVPEFRNGVFWVGLAPLRDPALVSATVAQALGAKEGLAEHVGEREVLLLLDNLEQVVEAAPELSSLLAACPSLRLLVTSRELLRIQGEVEYPVQPLAEPDAVELFCVRSRLKANEDIAELCRRLDNLPLAVELAAARAGVLTPVQILERLSQRLDLLKGGRDAETRQGTLRATIAWSFELLSREEQRLFARLAVFAGFTLEAAEEICDADVDTLQSLLDKNLVRRTQARYWMLETIRDFATEQLEHTGEAPELQRRHAEWCLAVAEDLDPYLAVSKDWLDRLEREHDNLRLALDRLGASGETQLALRLAEAQWRFWKVRGHTPEGRQHLEQALRADLHPTAARGRALNASAGMAVDSSDYEAGRRQAEEALALHRELGDARGTVRSMFMLGYTAIESGDFVQARPLFEESLRLFLELGDEHQAMLARFNLAWACDELGDYERSRSLTEENLDRARATGNKRMEAASLDHLAHNAREENRIEDALSMHRESLRLSRDLGDAYHTLDSVSRVAADHSAAGDAKLAARLLSSSLALQGELGPSVPLYQAERNEATLARLHAQLDDASFAEAWEEGSKLTVDEAVALALGREC